jgi:putative phosphoesterase
MKLGIISDTHDRIERLAVALKLFREDGVERLIHCGDVTSPSTVAAFAGWNVEFVLGNCDWDPPALEIAVSNIGGKLHEKFGELELLGRKIAWIHSDNASLFRALENADHYDYLFYGHTHVAEQHRAGKTLVCNPGALHRVRTPTFAVLDVVRDAIESIQL